jgi:hypothetical protein
MLFIICFFLGLGSAASCLFHLLYLLLVGQRAQGDIAAFGTLITIAALWKPLNYVTRWMTPQISVKESGTSRPLAGSKKPPRISLSPRTAKASW